MSPKKQAAPFSLRIPPKLRAELEEYAQLHEITLTQVILDLIRDNLPNH